MKRRVFLTTLGTGAISGCLDTGMKLATSGKPTLQRTISLSERDFLDQHGMAWDGEEYWIADNNTNTLYQVDSNFRANNSIPLVGAEFPRGITWANERPWITASGPNITRPGILRVSNSGKITDELSPGVMDTQQDRFVQLEIDLEGITFNDETFIATGPPSGKPETPFVAAFNKNGTLLRYLEGSRFARDLNGIDFFRNRIWIADDDSGVIHVLRPDFRKVTQFDVGGHPWGVAWNGTVLAVIHRGEPVEVDKVEFWNVDEIASSDLNDTSSSYSSV